MKGADYRNVGRQISGRTMKLEIDYEDVLSADSFDDRLLEIE